MNLKGKNIGQAFESKAKRKTTAFLQRIAGTERAMKTIKPTKERNQYAQVNKFYGQVENKLYRVMQGGAIAGNFLSYSAVKGLGGKPRYRRINK